MNRLTNRRSTKWTNEFSLIKAHAGNLRNELSHRFPKDAASDKYIRVVFAKNPKTNVYSKLERMANINRKKNGTNVTKLQ